MTDTWINVGESILSAASIAKIEEKRNCNYVADLCLKTKNGAWSEQPVAVFWQETPPQPDYSHYFGIFYRDDHVYITGAGSVEGAWSGVIADNGEIIFSRFRHDYRTTEDGTGMVDGGRDYFKHYGEPVRLELVGPKFELVEMTDEDGGQPPIER